MPALAQTSASPTVFSYQGRLLENGQPVTGLYELHFGLYDAVTDGASLGLVVDLVVVPVTNGLFVVTLDFQHQFDPQRSYFVEVGVWVQPRAGSTGFPDLQKMQPRQPILPVPLASTAAFAANAANAALADVATTALSAPASTNASLLSEGILPDARLDTNIVRQTNLVALQNTLLGAIAAVSNSVPSGALPSTNAALLSTGILPDARLGTNIVRQTNLVALQNTLLGAIAAVSNSVPSGALPSTNAALLSTGILPDARLDTNIVRRTDLVALENTLLGAITAVSNSVPAISLPAGVVVASADPNDPQLTAQGLRPFASFPGASWKNGSALGEPSARVGNTAVWTGSEFVVWGGETGAGDLLNDGERYRPAQDSWGLLSPISAPARRVYHTAVWTGAEMIVWGGYGQSDDLGDGGRYHLNNQAWAPVSLTNAPTPRASHNAVWTGRRMLIWGGYSHQGHLGTGGLYDPATDSWTALPDTGAPTPRSGAAAVWTGSEFLVWGGESDFLALNTGGRLQFDTNGLPLNWQATAGFRAPEARSGHTAVWTGSRMIVWGGRQQDGTPLATGGLYDPASNTWKTVSPTNAPTARTGHIAVWTGSEMMVFGGEDAGGAVLASAGIYDPVTDTWRAFNAPGDPVARSQATGVFGGGELLVFGGFDGSGPVTALQRVKPETGWHLFRKP